ncbi:hypothetical protein Hdeb2414_s0025g00668671 [Helianthus debilis subsp. tardiflorus]
MVAILLLLLKDNRELLFFERQIWITDGPLEYHRATSRTTRSYPSPLGNNAYTPIQEETQ